MVRIGDRAESARQDDRARAVFVRIPLHAVAHLQELLGGDVGACLRGQKIVFERSGNGLAIEVRINPFGLDDVVRRPLRPLAGDEEVRAVLDDRTTERRAVLVAPVG